MIERTPEQQQLFELIKVLRTAIRLEHSIAADRELNEKLPAAENAFYRALQRGTAPEAIDLKAIVKRVVG